MEGAQEERGGSPGRAVQGSCHIAQQAEYVWTAGSADAKSHRHSKIEKFVVSVACVCLAEVLART